MTQREFSGLQPGDLIRHKHSAEAVQVHVNFGMSIIAARVFTATNPAEWDRVTPGGAVKTEREA